MAEEGIYPLQTTGVTTWTAILTSRENLRVLPDMTPHIDNAIKMELRAKRRAFLFELTE